MMAKCLARAFSGRGLWMLAAGAALMALPFLAQAQLLDPGSSQQDAAVAKPRRPGPIDIWETTASVQASTVWMQEWSYDPNIPNSEEVFPVGDFERHRAYSVLLGKGLSMAVWRFGESGSVTLNPSAHVGMGFADRIFFQLVAPHYVMVNWGLEQGRVMTRRGYGVGFGGMAALPVVPGSSVQFMWVPSVVGQVGFAGKEKGVYKLRLAAALREGIAGKPTQSDKYMVRWHPGVTVTFIKMVTYKREFSGD